jgi:hypothetical protein
VGDTFNRILHGWKKLSQGRDLKNMVGYFRTTAVKPLEKDHGKSYDESRYLVHVHCLLALRKSDINIGLSDRLNTSWQRITKCDGTSDFRSVEEFSGYIEKELNRDPKMVNEIVLRIKELNGVNRVIRYMLDQNNAFRHGVDPEQLRKYLAIKMRYPKKRWNYTRGGIFKSIKIITNTTHKKSYKHLVLRGMDFEQLRDILSTKLRLPRETETWNYDRGYKCESRKSVSKIAGLKNRGDIKSILTDEYLEFLMELEDLSGSAAVWADLNSKFMVSEFNNTVAEYLYETRSVNLRVCEQF